MKLICRKCEREFKPKENGVIVVEMFSQPPKPYKLWSADLWYCPVCGIEIVAGFAGNPFAESYTDEMDAIIKIAKEKGQTIIYDYEK